MDSMLLGIYFISVVCMQCQLHACTYLVISTCLVSDTQLIAMDLVYIRVLIAESLGANWLLNEVCSVSDSLHTVGNVQTMNGLFQHCIASTVLFVCIQST